MVKGTSSIGCRWQRRRFGVVAAIYVIACAGHADASDLSAAATKAGDVKQEAKARFVSGQSHYNLNEFTEALVDFKEAYRLLPDPVFLYNLGQCERQLGHLEEAVRFYRSFLREQPKAPNRQDVVHKIEEIETTLKTKQAEAEKADKDVTPVAEPESAPPGPAVVADVVADPPSATNLAVTPSSPSPAAPNPAIPTAAPPARSEIPEGVASRIDLTTTPSTPVASESPAFYSHWWFWTAAGVVVVGAGAGIYAATASHAPSTPGSTLGSKRVF